MTKTIFINTLLVGITVLILCALLFFGVQYSRAKDETLSSLEQEARYAERGLMMSGSDYLESLGSSDRITWIDPTGEVLLDTREPLPAPNEIDSPEVISALSEGSGNCIRKSDHTGKSTMYYALKCSDGTILRLSRPMSAVRSAIIAVSPVFWIIVIVLIISGLLAYRAARQIVQPINDINLDHPESLAYPELSPLLEKISEQKMTIQDEAASREQMRREFTANVSHELKTPLTSISGFAELMAAGAVSDDKVKEFSTDIYNESQRLISLINDIIRLSQLDENAPMPEAETIDLYELSGSVVDSLKNIAQQGRVSISRSGESAKVTGVYRIIHEMVYNLCDNAIKYNRPGGWVDVNISDSPEGVKLIVEDNGIGISKENQKRVFERFYRVDKSHSKEIGGTGLGLSIVKHAAQYLDVKIDLESELGKGTKIALYFKSF